ncbi:MAG: DUF1801 domain-containing protein [Alphaproteobacteria bacterium]|nr:DUF1801 domain-containing protein [Alphaproteobacteria bacterium]
MDDAVKDKFATYPDEARAALLDIRGLIFELGNEHGLVIEETLKWGQLSYLTKTGSTIRIDHSSQHPDQMKIFFNCKTRLVETFKEIYGDLFDYESNRVVMFKTSAQFAKGELRRCLLAALKYHQLKQLPFLGF